MTAAFAALRPEQLSDATPQLNVLQRLGGAIGTAVLAVVLQRGERRTRPRRRAGGRLRHRLLVVAGDRGAGADPLRGAAARRETPGSGESRCRRAPRPRRAAGRVGEPDCPGRHPARTATASRGSELTELGEAFRRVFRNLSRLRGRDTHLGGSELSHAQFELLIELYERGALPAGELAAAARRAATVTQMLDHLAECGHVERIRSETDRRVVVSG